eukprot:10049897-Ditylum_brightwellii.AAC.1
MVEELQCGDISISDKVMFQIRCVTIIKHTKELLLEGLVCLDVPLPYLPVQTMSSNDLVMLLIYEKHWMLLYMGSPGILGITGIRKLAVMASIVIVIVPIDGGIVYEELLRSIEAVTSLITTT